MAASRELFRLVHHSFIFLKNIHNRIFVCCRVERVTTTFEKLTSMELKLKLLFGFSFLRQIFHPRKFCFKRIQRELFIF